MRLDELIGPEPARSLMGLRPGRRTPMPIKHKSDLKNNTPEQPAAGSPAPPVAPSANIGAFDPTGAAAPIAAPV